MADLKDLFVSATQRLFSNWTALRMAVEHGHGSKDSVSNFLYHITTFINENENLSDDQLAEELKECIDDEFDIQLEDESEKQIANILLKFNQYCSQGNLELVQSEMDKLPTLKPWILSREEIISQRNRSHADSLANNLEDSSSDTDGDDEDMETDETAAGADDGWTEVKTRRK
ncbi:pre-rRNA-processing protein TSR2 homolog isoform X2 [Microplitis mediator]|uniref:pre-rRNA-processing protein TSR2 homolog isoform X2 n=1 Tax=Microplitis mediator TaxID=375433 RepID=UPI0025542B6E|nr:pre-rRNA-processing protein TSR2 homolog isoform X2 [Microplitis mediator]